MTYYPLISCIMPTRNRRGFVEQAIEFFRTQDYPRKELIIIEDGEPFLCADLAQEENTKYLFFPGQLTIGEKRNIACSLARGNIICQFDDDDYYGSERLSKQIEPILKDEADITGLTMDVVYHVPSGVAWWCSPALHQEVFKQDVHTGTLMYRKEVWGQAKYPHKSIGEDADFLQVATEQGARLAKVKNDGVFVYMRHQEENIWPLPPHTYPHMHEWVQLPVRRILQAYK